MSWWFLNMRHRGRFAPTLRGGIRRVLRAGAPVLLVLGVWTDPPAASAADVYNQPAGSLTVEGDTNLDLDPGQKTRTEGNLVSASDIIGIATPDSDSFIRPRVEYRNYPEDSGDNRVEGYLDFNSTLRTQRSSASVYGTLEHLDEFNAELPSALYDNLNPSSPTSPETGKSVIGATRDSALVVPKYNFKYSPLWGFGVSGVYQRIDYSPNDDIAHVDFAYYFGQASATWTLGPRSELSFGAFDSKYEATRYYSNAKGTGGTLDLDTAWSPLLSTTATIVYDHVTADTAIPTLFHGSKDAFGATVGVAYKAQISQYRMDAGQFVTPSGGGSLYYTDQIKAEYDRDFGPRWSFTGALLALKNKGITSNLQVDGRTYVQTLAEVVWNLTPTWYLQGGARYMWEKYQFNTSGAADTRIYFRIGYKGLPPRR
jgi:hypothetical protein